jgi:hypothetical protein
VSSDDYQKFQAKLNAEKAAAGAAAKVGTVHVETGSHPC